MATETKTYDVLLKLPIIGDYGVGKTSILFRFIEDRFEMNFMATVGFDFKIRTVELDGKKIKLQIWDLRMSGTRSKTVTTSYYRGATGVMVVYDITNTKSFENTRQWINDVKDKTSADFEIMLLGNKCDEDDDKRQVSEEQGQQMATEYGIKFMETSAKNNINIEKAFFTLIEAIIAKKNLELTEEQPQKNNSSKSGRCTLL